MIQYRKNALECFNCKMKFHNKTEFLNHNHKFCTQSLYNDEDYLNYIQLREKIKEKHKKIAPSYAELIGLSSAYQKSDALDREMADLDDNSKKKNEEIELLVNKWKDQKTKSGVKSSPVEARVEALLNELDKQNQRKQRYLGDVQLINDRLKNRYSVTTQDLVKKNILEELIIERDRVFENENELIGDIGRLRELYLIIKDYEFEGKSAPKERYQAFQEILTNCEYQDELVESKRNHILNNFETATNDHFIKYFSDRGKNVVYDNETLKRIIQNTTERITNLKIDLRDYPKQMIKDDELEEMLADGARKNRFLNEPLVLRTAKQADNVLDQTVILRNIRKNIENYGVEEGLKEANAALIPQSVYKDQQRQQQASGGERSFYN